MTKITTSLPDETKSLEAIGASRDSNEENNPSFYDSIKYDLDQQLVEPSSDSVYFILNYSVKQKGG